MHPRGQDDIPHYDLKEKEDLHNFIKDADIKLDPRPALRAYTAAIPARGSFIQPRLRSGETSFKRRAAKIGHFPGSLSSAFTFFWAWRKKIGFIFVKLGSVSRHREVARYKVKSVKPSG